MYKVTYSVPRFTSAQIALLPIEVVNMYGIRPIETGEQACAFAKETHERKMEQNRGSYSISEYVTGTQLVKN